jgi:glycerol dehydrogenase
MLSTTIFPGRYIQGYAAIRRLGPEIARLGKTAFMLCSNTVYGKILPAFKDDLAKYAQVFPEKFHGECCDDEINRVIKLVSKTNCEVVIGMGGGKVMDTAKAVANKMRTPLIIVPTVAASDAPCSAVSVIYTPDGVYDRPMQHPNNPAVVLVDTKIIAEAPVRFLVAGMGDALSTRFEAESCQAKYAANMTFSGDIGSMTAYSLAQLCYQTLLEYGLAAKRACEVHAVIPALEHIVEANTLLSGLGFESCGLAGAHGIQIGFTAIKETEPYLHGEIVAFGTQASLLLTDRKKGIIDEVYTFCESVGLPTTLAEIGLPDAPDSALAKVAEVIMDKDNPIHNEAIPVSQEIIIAAIKAADHTGRLRKRRIEKQD